MSKMHETLEKCTFSDNLYTSIGFFQSALLYNLDLIGHITWEGEKQDHNNQADKGAIGGF
jgi:hypothetical protein